MVMRMARMGTQPSWVPNPLVSCFVIPPPLANTTGYMVSPPPPVGLKVVYPCVGVGLSYCRPELTVWVSSAHGHGRVACACPTLVHTTSARWGECHDVRAPRGDRRPCAGQSFQGGAGTGAGGNVNVMSCRDICLGEITLNVMSCRDICLT